MGLDNIPKQYPCKTQGTAVTTVRLNKDGVALTEEDGSVMTQIDCQATQACGGCPYVNELNKQDKKALGNPVYGMFGTDCWYRGKWGVHLLEHLGVSDYSMYGGDNDSLGADDSELFANTIEDTLNEWLTEHDNTFIIDGEELTDDVRYLIWWLRFVAREADGFTTWH